MKTKVSKLKKGDVIYDVNPQQDKVTTYEYLCVMPRGGGNYHVLVNQTTQEPVRMYINEIQDILDLKLENIRQAYEMMAKSFEGKAMLYREFAQREL